jgi:hypothetical protein
MGPDDLLCSRNARPQKALVGRAHDGKPPSHSSRLDRGGKVVDAHNRHRPVKLEKGECPRFFIPKYEKERRKRWELQRRVLEHLKEHGP